MPKFKTIPEGPRVSAQLDVLRTQVLLLEKSIYPTVHRVIQAGVGFNFFEVTLSGEYPTNSLAHALRISPAHVLPARASSIRFMSTFYIPTSKIGVQG